MNVIIAEYCSEPLTPHSLHKDNNGEPSCVFNIDAAFIVQHKEQRLSV